MNTVHSQFYSWYLYPEPGNEEKFELGECLSAAKYIDGEGACHDALRHSEDNRANFLPHS